MALGQERPRGPAGALAAAFAFFAVGGGPLASAPGDDGDKEALRVAVAANFRATFGAVATGFPREVTATFGASGLLYAQITQGGPFDVFLSADAARPGALVKAGVAFAPTTYAVGRLALLVNDGVPNADWPAANRRVAIANPEAAPYGRAAAEVLAAQAATPRRITALNVAQAFHFAASGGADGAFVALAQVLAEGIPAKRYWLVPEHLHAPIEQVAVAIRGGNEAAAEAFLAHLGAASTRTRIRAAGYR